MAKTDTQTITFNSDVTLDKLRERYASLTDQIQKEALSMQFKAQDFVGDPQAGSVEFNRLATAVSKAYGTARTAGEGDTVRNDGVTLNIDQDKEIVEEVGKKELRYAAPAEIVTRRTRNHSQAMTRALDTAFFGVAVSEGTELDVTSYSTTVEKVEALIQAVETTSNTHVDGVDRDMLVLFLKPSVYGALRSYIDSLPNPNEGGVDYKVFHDVAVFSNTRQTEDAICMAKESIAQPVISDVYSVNRIPLSNNWAIELYYSYGTKATMADLIRYADFSAVASA